MEKIMAISPAEVLATPGHNSYNTTIRLRFGSLSRPRACFQDACLGDASHRRFGPMLQRLLLGCVILAGLVSPVRSQPARTVEFNRDIRPILSNNCFVC